MPSMSNPLHSPRPPLQQLLQQQHQQQPPIPYLTVRAPTPTTISFTVSTRRPTPTLASKALRYLGLTLRVITACAIILAIWGKYTHDFRSQPHVHPAIHGDTRAQLHLHHLLLLIGSTLRPIRWRYLLPSALLTLWAVVRRGYVEESLLALRSLGLQTSTSSPYYLLPPTTRFIPTTAIQDVFLHEAFAGFAVKFYLAIVVEGEEDVVVGFPRLLPRRPILEQVWRGVRKCLYELPPPPPPKGSEGEERVDGKVGQ